MLNIQNINFNLNLNIQIIKIEFDFERYIFFYIKISDNQSHIKFYRSIAIIIFMSKQLTIAKFNYNFFFSNILISVNNVDMKMVMRLCII